VSPRARDWLQGFALDTRLALRRIRRDRVVGSAAALCLGLGLASILSVVRITDALWFGSPPGVRHAKLVRRLIAWRPAEQGGYLPFLSYPFAAELAGRVPPGVAVAVLQELDLSVLPRTEPTLVRAGLVTENFLDALGVPLAAGRGFGGFETGLEVGLVASYRFAARYFGSPERAVGQPLRIGRKAYIVSGVLEPGFLGTELQPVDLWLPLRAAGSEYLPPDWRTEPLLRAFKVFVHLNDPAQQAQVQAMATAVYEEQIGPSLTSPVPARVLAFPLQVGRTPWGAEDAERSRVLVLLSLVLWLVVCANFGGLVLARSIARQPETAIVLALGAAPRQVLRSWFLEAAFLALAGTAFATVVGGAVFPLWRNTGLAPQSETYRSNLWHVVAVISICLALAVASGLYVARRQTTRLEIASQLSAASRAMAGGRSRFQGGVLGAQVALSVALLYLAALFVQSFLRARSLDLGFDAEGLYVISPAGAGARQSVPETDRLFREIAGQARTEPGVIRTSVAVTVPFVANFGVWVSLPGQDSRRTIPFIDVVTPGYFETVGIRLLQGRDFDSTLDSRAATPSTILSRAAARELFGTASAIGQCVIVSQPPCRVVVGIVADVRQVDLRTPVSHVYLPLDQNMEFLPIRAALVRLGPGDARIWPHLQPKLQALAPNLTLQIRAMSDIVAQQVHPWRLSAVVLSTFSLIALGIMTLGIFGVVWHRTSRRARELGLRMALGASPTGVAASVCLAAVLLVSLGVGLGVLGGQALGRVLAGQLFGVHPADPASAFLALLLAASATLVASLYPAFYAAHLDPAQTLRWE